MGTSSSTPSWSIESNTRSTVAISVGLIAVGSLLVSASHHQAATNNNALAAWWGGILLGLLGAATLFLDARITLLVDPERGAILIRHRNRVTSGAKIVRFEEIASVNVSRIGRSRLGVTSFHLKIRLKSGKSIATGRWSYSYEEINAEAARLADAVGCAADTREPFLTGGPERVMLSVLGAVAFYALWYRFTTGPWCRAMWFGTAPPVIMLLAGGSIYRLLSLTRKNRA